MSDFSDFKTMMIPYALAIVALAILYAWSFFTQRHELITNENITRNITLWIK